MFRQYFIGIILFLCLFPGILLGYNAVNDRTAFLAALSQLQHGNQKAFLTISQNLQDYPLYPYLLYSNLILNLPRATPQALGDFLDTYRDTPLADHLRHLWLAQLAQQQQWQLFLTEYRPTKVLSLQCDQREAFWRTGQIDAALQNFGDLVSKNTAVPKSCLWVFAQALHQGNIAQDIVWERIASAFQNHNPDLATQLSTLLPQTEVKTFRIWMQIYNNPKYMLKAPKLTGFMVLTGLMQLSADNPRQSAMTWDVLNNQYKFDPETQQKAIKIIAIALARIHDPSALVWLNTIQDKYMDNEVRIWRIRMALFAQNWSDVESNVNELPIELKKLPQWRYWLARSLASQNRIAEAENIYRDLSLHGDFYGQLASVQLQQHPLMAVANYKVNAAQINALSTIPALKRSYELYQLKWIPEATQEWQWAIDHMPQEDYLAAAELAMQWGWFERAISTVNLINDGSDIPLRFPLAYREPILDAALKNNLDPAWVFALVRQESLFMPEVKSSAGALGLMQLMPNTALLITNQLHIPFARSNLLDPRMNVTLGSIYLSHMLQVFNNNIILATAAYNAGPGNVKKWLSAEPMPADVWIENIPFHETRNYVRNIMTSMTFYEKELALPDTLASRMRNPI